MREGEELGVGDKEFVQVERLEYDGVLRDFVCEKFGVIDLEDGLEARDIGGIDAERYGSAWNKNHAGGSGLFILRGAIRAELEQSG